MQQISQILNKKKRGIDCTEEESAEIKGFFREWNGLCMSVSDFKEIMHYFHLEYDEIEDEVAERHLKIFNE